MSIDLELARDMVKTKNVSYRSFERPKARRVAAALIDLHERMGRIAEEAVKWGCNHEDEQDEDSRMCCGDDCKCCYILALTKGKV